MKTFKILGLLLSYPEVEMISHLDELVTVLEAEKLLPGRHLKKIAAFTRDLGSRDIYELQENYVELFDRGRGHCLQLFEHIHGESRDRGQAMVNLAETYATKGLYVSSGDLPDYLPLFLEYLSLCPPDEALEFLGDPINVIAAIGVKLNKRQSSYAVVFDALAALSKVKPDRAMMEKLRLEPLESISNDELDAEWAEAGAFDNDDLKPDDCADCNAFPNATEALQTIVHENINGGQ
ncbi:MAG: nitrate reductase molybdenum cofactor assembly chaperone [Alphaproteobacteria bacterium]|nr:nitrate reductase molybdenum cofactor assembly chaperone [Alphaproteobacteria bacterium]